MVFGDWGVTLRLSACLSSFARCAAARVSVTRFEVLSEERFSSKGFALLFTYQEANRRRGKASQAVTCSMSQVVTECLVTYKETVFFAFHHCLVVLEQRVKRLQRDGLLSGAPGRTRTRNPLIRSQGFAISPHACSKPALEERSPLANPIQAQPGQAVARILRQMVMDRNLLKPSISSFRTHCKRLIVIL